MSHNPMKSAEEIRSLIKRSPTGKPFTTAYVRRYASAANARQILSRMTRAGEIISALWYLGKDHVDRNVIEKIRKLLTVEDFDEVLKHCKSMPAWMADAFYSYQKESESSDAE